MSYFDAESLRPAIRAILAGADQSQITARQVRKMLVQNDASLDPAVLNEHKEEINHITKSVFEALTALSPSPSASPSPPKPSTSCSKPHSNSHHSFPQHQFPPSTSTSSSSKPKSSHKVKSESSSTISNQTLTDAEYALSLSLSLNSHSTRGPSASASSSKSKSKSKEKEKRKRVQSSPTVDSDDDEGGGSSKKKSKKVKKVKNEDGDEEEGEKKVVRGGAFNKEMGLSEALQAVVGGDRMSRPQTVKKIWEYVKERDLQDASDKRYILCDDTLQAVFKVPKVHMFTMNKLLSKHIYPLDE
ncbi:hypothetical protein BDY24DRAFT_59978 [Mrakia frigida]|uniref:uncharacterized protein n=1 Tax=Mrakia frigida TaxID=29902 RepID=UPI003FCBF8CE